MSAAPVMAVKKMTELRFVSIFAFNEPIRVGRFAAICVGLQSLCAALSEGLLQHTIRQTHHLSKTNMGPVVASRQFGP